MDWTKIIIGAIGLAASVFGLVMLIKATRRARWKNYSADYMSGYGIRFRWWILLPLFIILLSMAYLIEGLQGL